MKTIPTLIGVLGLTAASNALAATTVNTAPVGGISVVINAGSAIAPVATSFVIPLFDVPLATGAGVTRVSAFDATTITATGAGWTPGALATLTFPYALQFTSGNAAGSLVPISGNTAEMVSTTAVNLTTLGLVAGASGDTFRLVPVDTLNTLFGSGTLLGGPNSTEADTVILSGTVQTTYYFSTTRGFWVRTTGSDAIDRGNVPIPFDSAITVVRKGPALTLRFTGRVPDVRFRRAVPNAGSTYTHTGFPTAVTLGALSLQTALPGWVSAASAAAADTITVGLGAGALTYFHNGNYWQRTTGATSNRNEVPIPLGTPIQIFKRGTAAGTSTLTRALPYSL